MIRRARASILLLALAAAACGSDMKADLKNMVGAKARVQEVLQGQQSQKYFQQQLILDGTAAESVFARSLSEIGLNGAELQAMPAAAAYESAHRAALGVTNTEARRRLLVALFEEHEQAP
jgi:hypothetical protein